MANIRIFACALVGLAAAACASTPEPAPSTAVYVPPPEAEDDAPIVKQKIGRPYQVAGRWYTPARQDDYDAVGQASWYGDKFHGRQTANGERFDMNALTAAHPTLPMPSYVQVTNLDNGRTAVLRVNDRGPFARGRILDVSRRAAETLGFRSRGTANVRVKYLGPLEHQLGEPRLYTASSTQAPAMAPETRMEQLSRRDDEVAAASGWFIQAGAFSETDRADWVRDSLANLGPSKIETVDVGGQTLHRVLVGPYAAQSEAQTARSRVASAGFGDARLVLRN